MQDLKDVPEEIKEQLEVVAVANVEEVLHETLGIALPRVEHVLYSMAEGQQVPGSGVTVG